MSHQNAIDPAFFAGLPAVTSFFLLRHGETTANLEGRIQGRSEHGLTENGRRQAAAAAAWFSAAGVKSFFCSPQLRARQSADIIGHLAGLPPVVELPDLMELDTGCYTGLTLAEVAERFPAVHARFDSHSWAAVPGAESVAQLRARAGQVWRRLRQAALEGGGNVLAVTHGGLLQWLVRLTFGSTSWMPLITTGNCGLFRLLVRPPSGSESSADDVAPAACLQWQEFNQLPADGGPAVPPVF
ncbi:MAG: hypothetical protein A2087_12295 [Spirochaetes bacterium GWD1_61_31]|nr:MAG: hypothetical protein A2Y37_07240 [Spirochaetes bacterium GWB1_60_80]OHD34014.1 MAG: hypothetical protein A2004_02170 [Spirochaetes bacterium GWC1_61_12]OHD35189.1 MAG: hypothetical protein A2087_12295 [Spirochaetes bacterium GWD1_61_31]OHD41394.1 MAG: hypothetical protein A2Y35_05485 [Spirochaetes bacterium GWE1_60_18]OHD59191.1 MAG: hypothetical protein A2Y32_00200 [Spirochaetes bacterium GWF1_60_12]HAP43109.1 hypothetical protein [Spirochaetaceae bacterium]